LITDCDEGYLYYRVGGRRKFYFRWNVMGEQRKDGVGVTLYDVGLEESLWTNSV
jgi:hypothetical protein